MSTKKIVVSHQQSADESEQMLFWLQQAHQTIKAEITRAFKLAGTDITTEQFSILSYLLRNPLASQSEIARATRRERASISRILVGMEDKGLVQRSALDMRTNHVKLTPLGSKTYRQLAPINISVGQETLADCHRDDIETVIQLLKRITAIGTEK